jgi:hypothetical protein
VDPIATAAASASADGDVPAGGGEELGLRLTAIAEDNQMARKCRAASDREKAKS